MKIINKEKFEMVYVGQTHKSVNKLIEYLEVPYNRNEGEKERVVEYIMDYVQWESTNNKRANNEIKITWKANDNVLIEPMLDGRIDTLTSETMGYMLLSNIKKFGEKDEHTIFFAKGYLYRECQMCNENWSNVNGDSEQIEELAKELNTKVELIYEFFDITNGVFNRNLNKGCRWLKNRKLALSSESYAIKANGIHQRVTDEEKAIILEAEYEILKKWGISYKDVWQQKKYRQFRHQVIQYIIKKVDEYAITDEEGVTIYADNIPLKLRGFIGLEYYYETIEFVYNYNHVKDSLKTLTTVTKREAKKVSNDKVKEVIDKRAEDKTYREAREYKKDMKKIMDKTIKEKSNKDK